MLTLIEFCLLVAFVLLLILIIPDTGLSRGETILLTLLFVFMICCHGFLVQRYKRTVQKEAIECYINGNYEIVATKNSYYYKFYPIDYD